MLSHIPCSEREPKQIKQFKKTTFSPTWTDHICIVSSSSQMLRLHQVSNNQIVCHHEFSSIHSWTNLTPSLNKVLTCHCWLDIEPNQLSHVHTTNWPLDGVYSLSEPLTHLRDKSSSFVLCLRANEPPTCWGPSGAASNEKETNQLTPSLCVSLVLIKLNHSWMFCSVWFKMLIQQLSF